MSNPYEDSYAGKSVVVKKGLSWAEYSIIVALLCIVSAFGYGWHVKTQTDKMIEKANAETTKIKLEYAGIKLELDTALKTKEDAEVSAKQFESKAKDAKILIDEIKTRLEFERDSNSGTWAKFGKQLDTLFK